jgi:hypothetical protein
MNPLLSLSKHNAKELTSPSVDWQAPLKDYERKYRLALSLVKLY